MVYIMNVYGCQICGGEESDYGLMEYCTNQHIYHKTCISKLIENKKYTPSCLSCFIYTISYIEKCDICLFCDSYLPKCPMKIYMCRTCEEQFTKGITVPKCNYCNTIHVTSAKRCANCRTCQGELNEISKGIFICKTCAENAQSHNQVGNVIGSNMHHNLSIKQQEELMYEESLKKGKSGKCVLCRKYDDDSFILCPKGYHYCKACKNIGDFTDVKNDCNCPDCEEILSMIDANNVPNILGQPCKEYEEPCSVCKGYKVYNYISQCKNNKLYCPSCLRSSRENISKICPCAYCQSLSRGVFPKFFLPCAICFKNSLFNYKSLCSSRLYYCMNCIRTRSMVVRSKCQCENCMLLSNTFTDIKCSICKQNKPILEAFVCQNRNSYCESCCSQSNFQKIYSICQCNACVEMCNYLYTNYMGKGCKICDVKFLPREESACSNKFYYCPNCFSSRLYEICQICNCPWCKMILERGVAQNPHLFANTKCKICLTTHIWDASDICQRKHFYCNNCLKAHKINAEMLGCSSNYCVKTREKWSKISYEQEIITPGNISDKCSKCNKPGAFECKKRHKMCDKCIFEGNMTRLIEIYNKISQEKYTEIDKKFWYRCGFKGCNECIVISSELMLARYDGYLSLENAEMLGSMLAYLDGVKFFACQLKRAFNGM